MKCLIIAAGKGSRLQPNGDTKPLIPILGVPLIERVIRSSRRAGADEFFVVTGYHSDRICSFLNDLSDRSGLPITSIVNEAWEKENGLSVLRARNRLGVDRNVAPIFHGLRDSTADRVFCSGAVFYR